MVKTCIALALILLVTSCRLNLDGPDDSPPNRFVVDGMGYSKAEFIGYEDSAGTTWTIPMASQIHMKGVVPSTGETFFITYIIPDTTRGTYTIPGAKEAFVAVTLTVKKDGATVSYFGVKGSLTVESWQKEGYARGTFSASCTTAGTCNYPVLEIKNGSFELRSE